MPYTTNIDDTGYTISRPYCRNDRGACDPDCGEMVLRTGAEDCEDDVLSRADVSYIAALHPGVGHAIADLLDTIADTTDLPSQWQALAVARALRRNPTRNEAHHMTTRALTAALDHAARGWHVFPLAPGSKRPAVDQWEARATTDSDRIYAAWTATPFGIGIACGPSGLLAIDLDQPKPGTTPPEQWRRPGIIDGRDVLATICDNAGQPLPPATYTVATPSGGRHLYYRQPTGVRLRNTVDQLGWLIDTRGHGGYVAAGGITIDGYGYTVLDDAPVAELPAWLAEQLTDHHHTARPAGSVTVHTGHLSGFLAAAIQRSVAAVLNSPDRGHNKALYGAAASLGQLVAGGALTTGDVTAPLLDAALAVGQPEREARNTIASGLRRGGQRPRTVAA